LRAGLFLFYFISFLKEADIALYIGYISSIFLVTEEKKGLEAHTRLYQPLKIKRKKASLQTASFLKMAVIGGLI
jgi:hypothetical protein